ncbi:MAG: glycosyltransferase, partial [Gammaproteobacteria bacterium]
LVRDQRDWPRQLRVTGFPYHDLRGRPGDPLGLPLGLRRFLDAGPPPLVFSLGSAAFWVARDFFQQSIEAAVALGQRAVLLVGDDRFLPRDPVPVGIAAYDYVPYGALFPHASVVVHHGGIGSIAQVLRAGRPMLVVPIAHDQYDNAARVGALGVARTLPRRRYQAEQVVVALRALLEKPSYAERARVVAEEVRSERGTPTAVDIIEEVLARGGFASGEGQSGI